MKDLICPKPNPAFINTWNAFSLYHHNDGACALADSFFRSDLPHLEHYAITRLRICGSETVKVFGRPKCLHKENRPRQDGLTLAELIIGACFENINSNLGGNNHLSSTSR